MALFSSKRLHACRPKQAGTGPQGGLHPHYAGAGKVKKALGLCGEGAGVGVLTDERQATLGLSGSQSANFQDAGVVRKHV